jgi:hypothetical protein
MTWKNSNYRVSELKVPQLPMHRVIAGVIVFAVLASGSAVAQEVRYSWLELSYMAQDVGLQGIRQTPVPNQTTSVDAKDGNGVRFRGSFGTWRNLYMFGEFGSSDIDVSAEVNNDSGFCPCLAEDEFDLTTIRAGIGIKWSVLFATDIYFQASYDSIDFDFGSFAGENFDTDDQDVGAAIGVRHMLNDDIELRAYGRYSSHSDVDLSTGLFDPGEYFGAGFSWEIVRGLAVVGDYETGDIPSWTLGFRLDLDED